MFHALLADLRAAGGLQFPPGRGPTPARSAAPDRNEFSGARRNRVRNAIAEAARKLPVYAANVEARRRSPRAEERAGGRPERKARARWPHPGKAHRRGIVQAPFSRGVAATALRGRRSVYVIDSGEPGGVAAGGPAIATLSEAESSRKRRRRPPSVPCWAGRRATGRSGCEPAAPRSGFARPARFEWRRLIADPADSRAFATP